MSICVSSGSIATVPLSRAIIESRYYLTYHASIVTSKWGEERGAILTAKSDDGYFAVIVPSIRICGADSMQIKPQFDDGNWQYEYSRYRDLMAAHSLSMDTYKIPHATKAFRTEKQASEFISLLMALYPHLTYWTWRIAGWLMLYRLQGQHRPSLYF